jgi:hypothetical protein
MAKSEERKNCVVGIEEEKIKLTLPRQKKIVQESRVSKYIRAE